MAWGDITLPHAIGPRSDECSDCGVVSNAFFLIEMRLFCLHLVAVLFERFATCLEIIMRCLTCYACCSAFVRLVCGSCALFKNRLLVELLLRGIKC